MKPIDLMTDSATFSAEDLKSRAMARLHAQGLGLAERLANVERLVYMHLGAYTASPETLAQIQAIGEALQAEELVYEQEKADTALLAATLAHEAAQRRLALPALTEAGGYTPEEIALDTSVRAGEQAAIDSASAEVVALAAARAAANSGAIA